MQSRIKLNSRTIKLLYQEEEVRRRLNFGGDSLVIPSGTNVEGYVPSGDQRMTLTSGREGQERPSKDQVDIISGGFRRKNPFCWQGAS